VEVSACVIFAIISATLDYTLFSGICLGQKNGYRLFQLDENDKPSPEKDKDDKMLFSSEKEICITERLFVSSLVAFVTKDQRRKLFVYHFKKGTEICSYTYNDSILAVKLNRLKLIVVLKNQLYIHNIKDMKILHTIRDMPLNKAGLVAMSNEQEKCFIAYPGSSQTGEVQVFDSVKLVSVTAIPAHNSPLAAVSFSFNGNKLATASEKGTVIRVFSIPEGDRLFEFRRGMKGVVIYCLAFDINEQFLVSSSNTGTVHVYKLVAPAAEKTTEDSPSTWTGIFGKALMSTAGYLPTQVTDAFTQSRGFAQVRLNPPGAHNTCALKQSDSDKDLRLLVVTEEGRLLVYQIDSSAGSEYTTPTYSHNLFGEYHGEGLVGESSTKAMSTMPTVRSGDSPTSSLPTES
jgi:autophagy-related protein 18